MESLLEYLDAIEDILDSSKAVPFSNKISVEKERIFDVIGEIRLNLPTEIRHAQRIIEEHDKIIDDATKKAANIMRDAEDKAKSLTDHHEIYKKASDQSNEMLEEAKKTARDYRLNAMDYADEMLEKTESMIQEAMENLNQQYKLTMDYFNQTVQVLYENRQALKGRGNG
jgi:vacuolar-type H+-ATPase subunit H